MKRFLLTILVSVFCLISAYAECPQPDAKEREQVFKLVAEIKNGERPNIKSVDDFLGALPERIRKNYLFVTGSRSLQGSSVKNPRVILTSPNHDVSISFGTDPELTGYDRVEMMLWNGKEAKFEFSEITFPDEKTGVNAAKPEVEHNPGSCIKCHGNPPRPNWDTYRLWYGLTPFNVDLVCGGTKEAQWFDSYLARMENKEPRFRNLLPPRFEDLNDQVDYEAAYKKGDQELSGIREMRLAIKFGNTLRFLNGTQGEGRDNGAAVRYFDALSAKNQCRISHSLPKNSNYEKYKYAFASATSCSFENLAASLPAWAQIRASRFFEKKKISVQNPEDGNIDFTGLIEDTEKRQNRFHEEKQARQYNYLQKNLGKEAAIKEFGKHREVCGLSGNQETSAQTVAALRFLLEPLETEKDVKLNSWSMSIDPGTYTFADTFEPELFRTVTEVRDEYNNFRKSNPLKADHKAAEEVIADLSKEQITEKKNKKTGKIKKTYECGWKNVGDENFSAIQAAQDDCNTIAEACHSRLSKIKGCEELAKNAEKACTRVFKSCKTSVESRQFCAWIPERSRKAFGEESSTNSATVVLRAETDDGDCGEVMPSPNSETFLAISAIRFKLLQKQAGDLFAKNCVACHQTGGALNAPIIDFADVRELEKLIQGSAGVHDADWGERIWSRISRNPEDHGRMPKDFPALTDKEQGIVRDYFNYLRKQSNPTAEKLEK